MSHDRLFGHLLIAAGLIAVSALVGSALRWLITGILHRIGRKSATPIDERIVRAIESRMVPLAIVAGCSLAIRELRKIAQPDEVTFHEVLDYLAIAAFILFVLLAFSLLARFLKSSVVWYVERVSVRNKANLGPAVVPFVSKLINIVVFFIVGMIVLDHLGVNIGGFLVSLGVGSLAIALAAQETIANMIAWFVILVDQPIRLGDKIRLPSGEEGEIAEIGLRSTRIVNPDNNLVIVPNGELIKNRIVNLSSPDMSTRVLVDLPVAYGTDLEQVRAVSLAVAAKRRELVSDPPPEVHVLSFGDFAIQMRFQARVANLALKFRVETSLREEVYAALRRDGIEFPRVQRLVSLPDRYAPQTPEKK